jgi:hypothetical protein
LSIYLLLLSLLYYSSLSYFINYGITHLLITSLPGEVGLAEYVCTHLFIVVFLAADPDCDRGVQVEGVRTQVGPVEVS